MRDWAPSPPIVERPVCLRAAPSRLASDQLSWLWCDRWWRTSSLAATCPGRDWPESQLGSLRLWFSLRRSSGFRRKGWGVGGWGLAGDWFGAGVAFRELSTPRRWMGTFAWVS